MNAAARRVLLALSLAAVFNPSAHPADAGAKSKNATVRLVSEVSAFQAGKPFSVALHMTLAPKWHTYWKNPGDAGMPIRIAWTLPDGWKAGELQFPTPMRSVDNGLALYGYDQEAAFLTEITPPASLAPGDNTIAAKVSWLECSDICIPGKAELRFVLPVVKAGAATATADKAEAPLFAAARAALPQTNAAFTFTIAEKAGNFVLMTSGTRALESPLQFFPETAGLIEAAQDQMASRTALGWELSVKRPANAAPMPASLKGIFVSGAGVSRKSFQFTATPAAVSSKK